jgi:hypothetical protein
VGKKSAEKICFELSEKLGGLTGLDGLSGEAAPVDSWESDLSSALTNLGFREDAVAPLLAQFKQDGPTPSSAGGDRSTTSGAGGDRSTTSGAGGDRPPLADAIRICLKSLRR